MQYSAFNQGILINSLNHLHSHFSPTMHMSWQSPSTKQSLRYCMEKHVTEERVIEEVSE